MPTPKIGDCIEYMENDLRIFECRRTKHRYYSLKRNGEFIGVSFRFPNKNKGDDMSEYEFQKWTLYIFTAFETSGIENPFENSDVIKKDFRKRYGY